jgi:hypothetical protein
LNFYNPKSKKNKLMARLTTKEKLAENVQVNINRSQEIVYWAKKYNVEPVLFQNILEQNNYSIAKTIASVNAR